MAALQSSAVAVHQHLDLDLDCHSFRAVEVSAGSHQVAGIENSVGNRRVEDRAFRWVGWEAARRWVLQVVEKVGREAYRDRPGLEEN